MTKTKIRNLCVFVFVAAGALAQSTPTSLQSLIAEARQNNAAIKAAESAIQTTRYMPKQASALPDTEVMVQHFTVGSPRPFAGYSNSDFAVSGKRTRAADGEMRSEEHTSELQSLRHLVCRLLL